MNIEEIQAHQRAFLQKAKDRKESITYNIEGVDIVVNPGVFPPATDTKLLAAHIKVQRGERILDLTTGSGAFAIIAGLQGASGVAVDINPQAVKNAKENFIRFGVPMEAIESDLFQNVPEERFDQVFANGPFFEGDITDPMDYACYGARKFIDDLLSSIATRLKPTGKLLIVLSEGSDLEHFTNTVNKNGLASIQTTKRTSDDGERGYRLYQVALPS